MPRQKNVEDEREAMVARLKEAMPLGDRYEWDEFLDSFMEDIISDLVRENGGWNSPHTFVQVRAVVFRMIQAWRAGRDRLRQEIQAL